MTGLRDFRSWSFSNMKTTIVIWHSTLIALFLTKITAILAIQLKSDVDENGEIIPNYRLPEDTFPEHYDIKLSTSVGSGATAFQGEVTIDVVIAKPTNCIVLHSREIMVSKVTVCNSADGAPETLAFDYEVERELLVLSRESHREFAIDTKWRVTIFFSGYLREDQSGFFLTKYVDDSGNEHYLAATQFRSIGARSAFPCYDQPDKLANFTVTIDHSASHTAISNMPVNEALSRAGRTVFLTSFHMPTYAVAIVVSDFEYTEVVWNGLTQRVYSRPDARERHKFALSMGALVADYLTNYYEFAFVPPKIDHIAIPDFAIGPIDHFGLTLYSEENLLYKEQLSKLHSLNIVGLEVANQVARQWLSPYLPISCLNLRLKEALATLISYESIDHVYPKWDIGQVFHTQVYRIALDSDTSNSFASLASQVQYPTGIAAVYDTVSHLKGGAVLSMWSNALEETVFRTGFRNLLSEYQHRPIREEHFYAAIQAAIEDNSQYIPASVSDMISTWTHQSSYPILTVTRNYEDGTFTVKQEAFHEEGSGRDQKTWYVPINYAVSSDPDFRSTEATHYLLNVTETAINDAQVAPSNWLILNKQSTGYYRINYDARNWNLIAEGLFEDPSAVHVHNRAQLMGDAYHFSASNRLHHALHLKLLCYLQKEDQLAPWNTALFILEEYNRYLRGDEKYDDFKFFVAQQVRPIYRKLGVHDIPGEPHNDKFTRGIVSYIACVVGVQECLEETSHRLKNHFYENITIEPYMRDTIFALGLRQFNDDLFSLVYQKLMNSKDKGLRQLLIIYLGHTQDRNQMKTFIATSIDESNNLSAEERVTLLRRAYSRGALGLLTCIEFLNENWNDYGNLGKDLSQPLDEAIVGMASYVVTNFEAQQLLALVSKVKNSPHVSSYLEEDVRSAIASNFEWLRQNGKPIMAWVSQYRAANDNFPNQTRPVQATP